MFRSDVKFIGMPEKNEVPPRISVRFTCPECGSQNLNIESFDVLGCQAVEGIDEAGNLVLGRPTFYTEESDFYLSCSDCSYEPAVDLDEPEERHGNLIKWLKDSHAVPEQDDEDDEHDESEE
ncbi:MAG: hypothetical protein RDU20_21510 [Desulfomonilaceae bacterium]|nr:hypothetical protein [Desulfomonilaceae bacterium]